ncbi:MAG: UDP-N-acetylmuramoyl-tripeptide--D-alanyl-D-alanine ligase [Flavobacteriales bacterium]|nr:UDP-N-acetylmuramoyl-tripeptide--D-alanyl-D-alanine ligase [Flavobacteriales bacterium]
MTVHPSISQLHEIFSDHPTICTDSRNIQKEAIFFALRGAQFNGNTHASEALDKGCSFAVIDDPEVATNDRFILVEDVLQTLQKLAHHHRMQFDIPVIAITGTNGKTTTKELCNAVLSQQFETIATEGNFNNHIGLPLTLLRITGETDMAIVEMGANHPGEIAFLCNIAAPTHGLITNIGKAHLEGFGSAEGVLRTKKELYDYLERTDGTCFIHLEDEVLQGICKVKDRVSYSDKQASPDNESTSPYMHFNYVEDGQNHPVQSKLIGSYNMSNALAAISVGRHFGIDIPHIVRAIATYQPSNNRSQVVDTGRNTLILDAYNANPTSVQAALESFLSSPFPKKMIILGDMLELGDQSATEHAKVLDQITQYDDLKVILVGEEFSGLPKSDSGYHRFTSTEQAKDWLSREKPSGYTVLLKGSRKLKLETLKDSL